MPAPQPIWQHLPVHFKENVVSKLDYNSRCQLRICSKEDKNLVDSRPVILDYLKYRITEVTFHAVEIPQKPAEVTMNDGDKETTRSLYENDAIDHLLLVFSNQKLIVNSFVFNVWGHDRTGHQFKLFKKLLTKIKERNLKLKVRNAIISTTFRHKDQYIEFVKNLDVGSLISMKLRMSTRCQLSQLSRTEQWKKVKELEFETRDQMDPKWVSHVEKLDAWVKSLNAVSISAMIQNFISKQFPRGSYFSITTMSPINNSRGSTLTNILKKFPIEAKNDAIKFRTITRLPIKSHFHSPLHTQKIEMTDQNNVFLIILCETNFSGILCGVNSFKDDLKKFILEIE
ncbi:hypothetical protein GCK72_013688 [Caenorhabditis remanei]|uniref:F-box domain-containing protein n=1 Tax=Caenorhabditis remanei TaxID=31234 RepID=A0A6A5GRN1_CAERE|nr:hypothetical protein GCK72_013688 [Caenorhabditis remanei]KAF1757233.1 hypothetical protein GCK72_013688 [Caenorhabditis remanei]